MKVTFNKVDDTAVIKFNNNKIVDCYATTNDFIIEIDKDDKVVGLEILHYSRNKEWASDLLVENHLPPLTEDDVVIFLHHGFITAFFNQKDIQNGNAKAKFFCEEEEIQDTDVLTFLQQDVDVYQELK